MLEPSVDLVAHSYRLGETILARRSEGARKAHGQFLTPPVVARYMARQLGPIKSGARILDPAIGSATLACAVIERLIQQGEPLEAWIDGFEIDADLTQAARTALRVGVEQAAAAGIVIHAQVQQADFLWSWPTTPQLALFDKQRLQADSLAHSFTHSIANPPYFKLNSDDPRVQALTGMVPGHTNVYTLILALVLQHLAADGQACFIIPRSFCSGAYFAAFRRQFLLETIPLSIHLFESRVEAFKADEVLQENVIIAFKRRPSSRVRLDEQTTVAISTSAGIRALERDPVHRLVEMTNLLSQHNGSLFFRLPTGELDEILVKVVDGWGGSLHKYGLEVSTGPVVAFRAEAMLRDAPTAGEASTVPLLWMQHVKAQHVEWPLEHGRKPQFIIHVESTKDLLLEATNYVLLRRFSAKEESRRLVAAPFLGCEYHHAWVGLENHLNYIYRKQGQLGIEETVGLAALLNSSVMDRYFRIVNGNTQVNATELRALPLPPHDLIVRLGQHVVDVSHDSIEPDLDAIVTLLLVEEGLLPSEFPILRETRIAMGKIQEAQQILKALGLPPAQQNEISALTLLVLAQLSEDTSWTDARPTNLRIHDILLAIKERYHREYAENTRETIRRQVIHQFEQAGLITRNPDEPGLATNSPRTHYALSDMVIQTLRQYDSEQWTQAVQLFLSNRTTLLQTYQRQRQQQRVPLRFASGVEYYLSPGEHNALVAAVVQEFGPRFAPGARVIYLGDTANKTLVFERAVFEQLAVSLSSHEKLPDVVLYDDTRKWLFLIEAVTSHGPVSPKRYVELEQMFAECQESRIYVSAFSDTTTFKSFVGDIAWETEVWLAERPDHLIHFNGGRFLGPYNQ